MLAKTKTIELGGKIFGIGLDSKTGKLVLNELLSLGGSILQTVNDIFGIYRTQVMSYAAFGAAGLGAQTEYVTHVVKQMLASNGTEASAGCRTTRASAS